MKRWKMYLNSLKLLGVGALVLASLLLLAFGATQTATGTTGAYYSSRATDTPRD